MTALVDTDWYPASYPWHVVIELSEAEKRITIKKGDPICRVIPVRRDTYFAQEMSPGSFDEFFARGQKWLATHGRFEHEGTMDITRTYVRQQARSRLGVLQHTFLGVVCLSTPYLGTIRNGGFFHVAISTSAATATAIWSTTDPAALWSTRDAAIRHARHADAQRRHERGGDRQLDLRHYRMPWHHGVALDPSWFCGNQRNQQSQKERPGNGDRRTRPWHPLDRNLFALW
jgi:hypothetical protein